MKYPDITLDRIEAVLDKLGGKEGVARLLAGNSEVVVKNHIIDLNKQPYVPDGWTVAEHQGHGSQLIWDASRVQLYLSSNQRGGEIIEGNKLYEELEKRQVLNANVLDYLLANPQLIPEEWKMDGNRNTRYIFFWGTIYCNSDGSRYVRHLCWFGGSWDWSHSWLGSGWSSSHSAALLTS